MNICLRPIYASVQTSTAATERGFHLSFTMGDTVVLLIWDFKSQKQKVNGRNQDVKEKNGYLTHSSQKSLQQNSREKILRKPTINIIL